MLNVKVPRMEGAFYVSTLLHKERICDSIRTCFCLLEGLNRHPVVRKCVPILELHSSYESIPALAEEFTNIMKDSQAWSFHII